MFWKKKDIAQQALINVTYPDSDKPDIHRFIKGFIMIINSFAPNQNQMDLIQANYNYMKTYYFDEVISKKSSNSELEEIRTRIINILASLEEILKKPFKVSDNNQLHAAVGTNNEFVFHLSLLIREVYNFQEVFMKINEDQASIENNLKIFQITKNGL